MHTPRSARAGSSTRSRASRRPRADSTLDGRVQRGARNRKLVVDAVITLVRATGTQPSAEEIAHRAGVGTRTVFRHFADMDSLSAAVATHVAQEIQPLVEVTPIEGTLAERVRELVRRRARVYERLAPFRRAWMGRRRTPVVQDGRRALDAWHRTQLTTTLTSELRGRAHDVVELLDVLASFEAWDRLRTDQGLGRDRARAVVESGILAVLESVA